MIMFAILIILIIIIVSHLLSVTCRRDAWGFEDDDINDSDEKD